jgi:hypothetical protein
LNIHGFPTSIEEWEKNQQLIWPGHKALPEGWIRVWSRSEGREYYIRKEDGYSCFDLDDVFGSPTKTTRNKEPSGTGAGQPAAGSSSDPPVAGAGQPAADDTVIPGSLPKAGSIPNATRCFRTGMCVSIIRAANSYPGDSPHEYHFHTTVPNWWDMSHTLAMVVIAVTSVLFVWNQTSKPKVAPKAEEKVGVDASTMTDPCHRYLAPLPPPPDPFAQPKGLPKAESKAPPSWAAPLPPPPDPIVTRGLTEVYVTEFGECAHVSAKCQTLFKTHIIRKRICARCGQGTRAGK